MDLAGIYLFVVWAAFAASARFFLRPALESGGVKTVRMDAKDFVLFACIACFVVFILSKFRAEFAEIFPDNKAAAVFAYAPVYQILIITAVFWFKNAASAKFSFGWRFSAADAKLALKYSLAALAVAFLAAAVSRVGVYRISGKWEEEQEIIKLFLQTDSIWLRALAAFSFLVLAPISEELLFRGLLYRWAKSIAEAIGKHGAFAAALVVSAVFAAAHSNAAAFASLFVVAMFLTALYEKTGSIVAPMLCHCIFNFVNVALILWAGK